jgi:glycosyltransferase involved in cell wall biosynthesis
MINMLNVKPIISIIIPIYNGEKWLPISLHSVLAQTFKDFEILLVDDGSTDTSGEICQNFLKEDARIRYFYKNNGGVSSARNLGLEKVQGELVYFFDCDDVLAPDALEFLVNLQKDTGADIVSCACMEVYKQAIPVNLRVNVNIKRMVATRDKWNYREIFTGAIICKLFSSQVIGNTCFQEDIYYAEDDIFFMEVFIKARKIAYCPIIKTFYYLHSDSSTHRPQSYRFFQSFVLAKYLIKEKVYTATTDANVRAMVYCDYCTSIFSLFRYVVRAGDRQEYERLHDKYSDLLAAFLHKEKMATLKTIEYKTYIKSYELARLIHVRKI